MTSDPPGNLEERLAELTARVWRLEQTLVAHGITVPPPFEAARPAGTSTKEPRPVVQTEAQVSPQPGPLRPPIAPPTFASADRVPTAETASLENRIGSQWFNRVGILAVLIGVAWFLKMAFDNHWIGPLGRVLIGLLAGAALIAWSERFHRKGFAVFAYSLQAVGSGTLYLSLWAAFSVYALIPAGIAFGAMIVVTGFNGWMSWIRDTELLALYAIAGGLSTPLLVSTGGNHEVTLFSYLLMLDLAVLVLVVLRPWSRLLFVAFVGTMMFVMGWWSTFYTEEQAGRTAFFLCCFFLIFAFAPRMARVSFDEAGRSSAWDKLAVVVLPIVNAGICFVAFYSLISPFAVEWGGPWLAVAFAAFYLLLLWLPARGVLLASPTALSALHLTAAVVFLTIAIPLKTHGRWLTIGWLVEGAALVWVSTRLRSVLLRALALVCLGLGLIALLTVNPPASTTPIFNQRFGTYLVAIAVFVFVGWIARRAQHEQSEDTAATWNPWIAGSVLTVNVLILLAVGWEIHSYWWSPGWYGNWRVMHEHHMYAQFSYSAFFMLFGAVLLATGFWQRSSLLRWQALVLLAVSIAKVFLIDISELSQGFRILSFLGLGALLLTVSFAYQHDWLHLRDTGARP